MTENVLHIDSVKWAHKNYRGAIKYGGFVSPRNCNYCHKCFFSNFHCPRDELWNRQSQGVPGWNHSIQTCYEAAALKSHISLPSHTLHSHCLSINLHHPAIWSPSSHSETQILPTRVDLTRTSPMHEGPRVISLPFVSSYKHGLIYAHTWNTKVRKCNIYMHMH